MENKLSVTRRRLWNDAARPSACFGGGYVRMGIDQKPRAGKARPVDERGVTQRRSITIASPEPHQRRQDSEIGHIAGRKKKRRFLMQKSGQRGFQILMNDGGSAD